MEQHICKQCYRWFEEKDMQQNASGEISDMCRTCCSLLGKGAGYASFYSDEEVEKWFEGVKGRREKYERENRQN